MKIEDFVRNDWRFHEPSYSREGNKCKLLRWSASDINDGFKRLLEITEHIKTLERTQSNYGIRNLPWDFSRSEKETLKDHIYCHRRYLIRIIRNALVNRLRTTDLESDSCLICLDDITDPFICLLCGKMIGCLKCVATANQYNQTKCLRCHRHHFEGITSLTMGDRLYRANGVFGDVEKVEKEDEKKVICAKLLVKTINEYGKRLK